MQPFLPVIYFVGLFTFGIALGTYEETPEFCFMIIGGGAVAYAVAMGILGYLHKKED